MKLFWMVTLLILTDSILAMPAPQSMNCKDKDGVETSDLCVFGQAQIGDWTLHMHNNDSHQEAVKKFLEPKIKSASAKENCLKLGGKVTIKSVDICQFSDESFIGLETLFRGAADPSNAGLVKAIKKGPMVVKPFHLPME